MFVSCEVDFMERTILHVDANSFFASVECALDPSVKDKPVAVVGNAEERRGIILAANYIAKKQYGIKTAEPIWQAERKCPDLIKKPSNMKMYLLYSRKLREILLSYSDYVEPFGCDEAWVELRGTMRGHGFEIAEEIRERVKKELDITVSIGVSFNKVFAKLGSDLKKPDAVSEITRDNYRDVVWKLPVENLLFVGGKTKQVLNRRAVYTIGDLAQSDPNLISSWLGKNGYQLYAYANGNDSSPVALYEEENEEKSVSASTTCSRDLVTRDDVITVFRELAEEIAERLRYKGHKASEIIIRVRDTDLKWTSHGGKVDVPTDIAREIVQHSMAFFDEKYKDFGPIHSIGISAGGFDEGNMCMQMDIWGESEKREKLEKLERVGDALKGKFNEQVLFNARNLCNTELTTRRRHKKID